MEVLLRAALIAWLSSDPSLAGLLNGITEETPLYTSLPWLAISASASVDWSTKTEIGYETRIALELHLRADQPAGGANIISAVQNSIRNIPSNQTGFQIIGILFMRSRAEQRTETTRDILLEYRFHTIAS